jgi:hypothetical protein
VVIVGAWTMVDPAWFGQSGFIYGLNWWHDTWTVIKGCFGPMLMFIGLIVVWITYEESKS